MYCETRFLYKKIAFSRSSSDFIQFQASYLSSASPKI